MISDQPKYHNNDNLKSNSFANGRNGKAAGISPSPTTVVTTASSALLASNSSQRFAHAMNGFLELRRCALKQDHSSYSELYMRECFSDSELRSPAVDPRELQFWLMIFPTAFIDIDCNYNYLLFCTVRPYVEKKVTKLVSPPSKSRVRDMGTQTYLETRDASTHAKSNYIEENITEFFTRNL